MNQPKTKLQKLKDMGLLGAIKDVPYTCYFCGKNANEGKTVSREDSSSRIITDLCNCCFEKLINVCGYRPKNRSII